jgi:UDP-N-acetyl-D-galactosamine dehydrogenase
MFSLKKIKIGVIGLGYVGLPLALEFAKKYKVIGYDKKTIRVKNLLLNHDETNECSRNDFILANDNIAFTSLLLDLKRCNIFIITVPTPVNNSNYPNFSFLLNASRDVGSILKEGDIVIYESTVYPGATEEICIPLLEKISNLKLNKDFYVGYSPERINPGDKKHKFSNIMKITSGSNKESSEFIDKLYSSVIKAGTFKASSIKVAEAAKAIENAQRDINIAFVNELAIIFNLLKIDTDEVLKAASTKWNFLNFYPGLVGGHCIGVDPYYLTYKSKKVGYRPRVILSGRAVNDSIAKYVAERVLSLMDLKNISIKNSQTLILGLTFKENCPDIRNSKVFDIISELQAKKISVDVYDPWVKNSKNFNFKIVSKIPKNFYDSVIIAVAHNEFKKLDIKDIKNYCKKRNVIFDVKSIFKKEDVDGRL